MNDTQRKSRLLGRASHLAMRAVAEFRAALAERDEARRLAIAHEQIAALAGVEGDCRRAVTGLVDEAERAAVAAYADALAGMTAAMRTLGEDRETAGRLQ